MPDQAVVDYNITRDHIPVDLPPTRIHTLRAVEAWHVRNVIRDSYTYEEVASRLRVSKKTLWEMRKRHNIKDRLKEE